MGKKETSNQPTTHNELGALAPKPVVWDIGSKHFEQLPLRIDRLSDVMEEIVDIVLGSGRGAIFDQLIEAATGGDGDGKNDLGTVAMPILVRTMVGIPKRLPKIVSMILGDAKEQYLRDHMNARQALQIVRTFIEQNEIGALIQDFFGLATSVSQSIGQAATETQEEAKLETVKPDSESEATETEED